MKKPETLGFIVGIIIGLFLCAAILVIGFGAKFPSAWIPSIIEHGCGQYNPQSGDFEWIAGGHDG